MTMESTRDWLSITRSEKPWRPGDYLPLATHNNSRSASATARQAFSQTTPDQNTLIARLFGRVAAQERQVRHLLDQLQRLRNEQAMLYGRPRPTVQSTDSERHPQASQANKGQEQQDRRP
jgi:hypothetical protein